jgi:DNA (cytosine-5)-methyltransferase 1
VGVGAVGNSHDPMTKGAYYNEIDPYAAQWLRNLIDAGHIARGDVDERSIVDVRADDLRSYTQCHFFAGIGGWSYALRLAGWDDARPVWTGSCPCQPFSIAGEVRGVGDERHLWPEWFRLIQSGRPPTVFGEQVASKAGYGWLAGVHLEMESADYSFGAADLCAASVQAKHPRQRLFFVAHASDTGLAGPVPHGEGLCGSEYAPPTEHGNTGIRARICFEPNPGTLVRIDGLPRPVGYVRGFGNAIVPQVAAEFIRAASEA